MLRYELMKNIKFIWLVLFTFNFLVCLGKQRGSVKSNPRVYEQRLRRQLTLFHNNLSSPYADNCAICLEGIRFAELDTGKIANIKCKHLFHASCLDKWLKQKSTCPMCRQTIENKSLNKNLLVSNSDVLVRPRDLILRNVCSAASILILLLVVYYGSIAFWHSSFVPEFRDRLSQVGLNN